MSFFKSWKQKLRRLFGHAPEPAPKPRTTTYAAPVGLVEITAPPSAEEPPAAIEEEHHQFIVDHWPRLAAAAYTGFQRHGIGVVVIEERASRTEVTHPSAQHTLAYATGTGTWAQTPPHSAAPGWLEEQFQTYEPLEAGLFLFRGGAAHPPRPYRAEGTLTPPEALRRVRAPFN